MELWRKWSAPIVGRRVTALPPAVIPAPPARPASHGVIASDGLQAQEGTSEKQGWWDACDVWVSCPANWADVEFELRGLQGPIAAVFDRKFLTDIDGACVAGDGTITGLLFSVRSRPVSSFVVAAFPTLLDHLQATFYMRCWVDLGPAGDRTTRQVFAPWAHGHQQVGFAGPLASGGATAVFAAPADGGRVNITGLSLTGLLAVPGTTVDLVETTGAGPVVRRTFVLDTVAQLDEQFTYPLEGTRGGVWSFVVSAFAGTLVANVTGYEE